MRSGPIPGATFSLEGDQLTIGRDSSNGVAINDAEISRKHARLTFQGGKYVIEDLGSTNGTFVNGQRLVNAVVLKSGDVVSFGEQIMLLYEALSSDPGATIISARKSSQRSVPAPSPAPAPAPAPAPQQYYSPSIAAGDSGAKKNNMPLFIAGGVLILICLCVILFVGVDQLNYWCTFPFSIIVKVLGSSCP
jgi:pSer/pThr/pTyr-binding forkhead associated (FHA) protein